MNKLGKMTAKLVAAAQILAITILAACTANSTITFCHATGEATNPYKEITVTRADLNVHLGHPNDFYPVPATGCPTSTVVVNDGKIAICHATDSETSPYNEITVSVNGLGGHDKHFNDIIPVPEGGCPTSPSVISAGKINVCRATGKAASPYEEITVTRTQLNHYNGHPNDVYPMPANGCPTSALLVSAGKVTICHATSSETNPYNTITVSVNGLNGHDKHPNDIIPEPEGGCPTSTLVINAGKITICHATNSATNPYNEITVSVNGLNGHNKHAGDIIPAPEGGCPTTRP